MRNDSDTERQSHTATTLASTRREQPRARLDWIVYLNLRSGNGGIVLDISEKGLALQTADRMSASGPVHFRFLVPSLERLEVAAEVIWLDETKKRGGLRFTDLPANVAREIREWVRHSSDARKVEQTERVEQARNDSSHHLSRESSSHLSPRLTEMPPKEPAELAETDRLKAPSELRKWAEGTRKQNLNARPLDPLTPAPGKAPIERPVALPVAPPEELNIPLDPQVRAAEAEALERARRRAEYGGMNASRPATALGKVEITEQESINAAEEVSSSSVQSSSVQSSPVQSSPVQSSPVQSSPVQPSSVQSPPVRSASMRSSSGQNESAEVEPSAGPMEESNLAGPGATGTPRTPHAAEEPNRFAATHIGASTLGTLSAGGMGAAERARRGDFPDHVRGLYAQHLEDDDPPWHWSATVLLAVVLGAAVTLLAFNYKVPIGHAVIRVGQKISGMAGSGPVIAGNAARAYSPASGAPPAEAASAPPHATTSGELPTESSNAQRGEATHAPPPSPSFEISSRDAGVAPHSADQTRHPRAAETKTRQETGSSDAWKYAQQHPRSVAPPAVNGRRAFGATPGASSGDTGGDTGGGPATGHDGDGAPELRLAQQYLGEGKNAAAADVLWVSLEKGNVEAEIELADLYGRGQGVPKSCAQAHVLVTAATEKSYALAEEETARLNALGCK